MKNDRGTLRVKTQNPNPNSTKAHEFPLGPFTVTAYPRYHEGYTRYTISANGVPIRNQISYPEVDDGWQGIAFSKANRILTEEQLVALKEFGHIRRDTHRRVK